MCSISRRATYFNPSARTWTAPPSSSPSDEQLVAAFHRSLPGYAPTKLHPLPSVARDLNLRAVYLKEESNRFSLPSFKILGASWGAFRALVQKLRLPLDAANVAAVQKAAAAAEARLVTLYAATDGNHGRAVARMGSILGVPSHVFVPKGMHAETRRLIAGEGAQVTVVAGSYDEAVRAAAEGAERDGGILVQDTAFEGYEEIPNWIIEGYATLLHEIDTQLPSDQTPSLVIAPVGVGSLAQTVVSHYKAKTPSPAILTVEADTAASLYRSLRNGAPTSIPTPVPTIMAGLDCGTVSKTAWPYLSAGVDASLSVSDYEAHLAVQELDGLGISAGPCGAASLAALRRLTAESKARLGLNSDSVVVLISTEGQHAYDVTLSVEPEDALALAQALVRIDSVNPAAAPGAKGELGIARWVAAWLEHRDIETHWLEETVGRPSVVGVVRGTGGGKSLMFNGHLDTVTITGYKGEALSGTIEDGKLFGRGTADMKSGIAAALAALVRVKSAGGLQGDVIFAGVADEEHMSLGTKELLRAGWRADAAIVGEPTGLDVVVAHKGQVWLEVDVLGVAAHGSRPDLGIDAITRAGYFLVELDRYTQRLQAAGPRHPLLGTGSVHASLIAGGEEVNSYPARCALTLERRTVAGETADSVRAEVEHILARLAREVPGFRYELRVIFSRSPFEMDKRHPFVALVGRHATEAAGRPPEFGAVTFWADSALLADAGIPVVIYGARGEGLHASEEWVEVRSVEALATAYEAVAREFCG